MNTPTRPARSGRPDVNRWRSAAFALAVVVAGRLVLALWGIAAPELRTPLEPADEVGSSYLGAPRLEDGWAGLLLGPWQRFDTQHYVRIAREGYDHESSSVFPPLYPLLIRIGASPMGGGPVGRMLAALGIATICAWGAFFLLHRLALREIGREGAWEATLLLATFPTGFFLFAGYSESLFLMLALGSFLAARDRRLVLAGSLGALASLTRLTGWVLAAPIAWEGIQRWRQSPGTQRAKPWPIVATLLAVALPLGGTIAFLAYRHHIGLPPLDRTYIEIWARTPGLPGQDLLTAFQTLFLGGPARAWQMPLLWVDFVCAVGMLLAIPFVFRELGVSHGLYAAGIAFFILLATSDVVPLYGAARYVLTLFPVFLLAGRHLATWKLLRFGVPFASLLLWLTFSLLFFARNFVG